MILLYVATLAVLAVLYLFVSLRTSSSEGKYFDRALELEGLLTKPVPPGSEVEQARRQYLLLELVRRKDHAEERNDVWARRKAWLAAAITGLLRARGRTAPYLLGMFDAVAVGSYLERAGLLRTVLGTDWLAVGLTLLGLR